MSASLFLAVAVQFSIPIGPTIAADISSALALVARRPETVEMIRRYRGGVDFNTNPDILFRRERDDSVYCPHQVVVFVSAHGPDLMDDVPVYEVRWVVNTAKQIVEGPVQTIPQRPGFNTSYIDRCIDGRRPIRLKKVRY